jgi:AcrR family transcriptional regulator
VPKVTEAHLAARRQQIIDAARTCFLQQGFHATSMQHVIAEAGLSIGAVYRYFPSKNDLIMAIAGEVVADIGTILDGMVENSSLTDAMSGAVDTMASQLGPDGALRLAVQIWAEAQHDPALAEFAGGIYRELREKFVSLAKRAQGAGELPADADPQALGAALFALLPGYGLQHMLTGGPDPELFKAGVRALLAS